MSAVREEVTVLVVDDQLPFRLAAARMLAPEDGFRLVGEAEDGEQAVEMAAVLAPALVLMDVRLPGIDGIEATRRILASHPGTAVVLVSTHAVGDLPPSLASCGARGFLRKHEVDPDTLEALLESPSNTARTR